MINRYDVLIVDDTPDWQERMQAILPSDTPSIVVSSAEEAIAILKRRHFFCALVDQSLITEAQGSDTEGMAVLNAIANLAPETRCFMVTAHGSTETAFLAGKELQIEDYLSKTKLDPTVFAKRIEAAINSARADYERHLKYAVNELAHGYLIEKSRLDGWLDIVVTTLAPKGRANEINRVLGQCLKNLIPLLPYSRSRLPPFDPSFPVFRADYWSKRIGQAVQIQIQRTLDKDSAVKPAEAIAYAKEGSLLATAFLIDRTFDELN